MSEFLSSSDAFIRMIESDPRLRSTIVTMILLDRVPDWAELTDRFKALTEAVPTFRQRIVSWPVSIASRWERDTDFDLSFHLRRVRAPAPAEMSTLLEMARIAAMTEFDSARPLWEATLVDGLVGGGAALLCKLNHALTDGMGAVQIATHLYGETDQEAEQVTPERRGGPVVGSLADVVGALPRLVGESLLHPFTAVGIGCSTLTSVVRAVRPLHRGSPLMSKRSTIRRLSVHHVPKEMLARAGRVAGGSLNDAFIAAMAGGLRRYHEKFDVWLGDVLVTMPVSIRRPEDAIGGNRTMLTRFDAPAGVRDPVSRIRLIHNRTSRQRTERSLRYTQLISGALMVAPRRYVGSQLSNVDMIASDVPGFRAPVSLAGAGVQMQYAFSPTLGAALNATLLSYLDTCAIGINVDAAAVTDVQLFHDCLVAGFDEVLALAN